MHMHAIIALQASEKFNLTLAHNPEFSLFSSQYEEKSRGQGVICPSHHGVDPPYI